MDENVLTHHGILGMKWGKRHGPPYPLTESSKSKAERKASTGKTSGTSENKSESSLRTKKISEMTDAELKDAISRLQLEQQYRTLLSSENKNKTSKGKAFVMDVLEKSGKDIATQFSSYAMGTALNKIAGDEVVNPKKMQKAK